MKDMPLGTFPCRLTLDNGSQTATVPAAIDLWQCGECGAAVSDLPAHYAWHNR